MCLPFIVLIIQDSEDDETDVTMTLNLNQGPQDQSSFQAYIPEDFANFEIYNATLEGGFRSDSKGNLCGGGSGDREVPRSPTSSSCTSGYFSHSASNATLSDMPFSASESSDHLNCTSRETHDPLACPAGRAYTQIKSVSAGSDTQQPPLSSAVVHDLVIHSASLPVSIPNCTDKQQSLPHHCVLSTSQEFTDFKGADDSIAEKDLAHFTEGWELGGLQEGLDISKKHHERMDNGKQCDSDNQLFPDASSNASNPENSVSKCPNYEDPVSVAVLCPNSTVASTSVKAPIPDTDKSPSPSFAIRIPSSSLPPPASPSAVTNPATGLPSAAPALRAGGEPPIQEPAQGDLPHGSPCPSPNPSSAEPSGDSSGDESTPVAQLPDWMAPGEQVWVGKRRGTVHYVGGVEFAKGIWIGVKLDMAVGKSFFFVLFFNLLSVSRPQQIYCRLKDPICLICFAFMFFFFPQ